MPLGAEEPRSGAALSGLERLAAAIRAPEVLQAIALEGPIELGRGELTPAGGTTVFRIAAQGIPCGLWVAGPARLVYRIEDRFSLPVAVRNLKRAPGWTLRTEASTGAATADVSEAVVWGWEVAPTASDLEGPASGRSFSPWAERILSGSLLPLPERDLLLARANGGAGYAYALLRGDDDLVLQVDPRPHVALESMQRLQRLDREAGALSGRLRTVELVAQPIGRAWWEPAGFPFTLSEVTSVLVNDRESHLRTRARLEIVANAPRLSLLALEYEELALDERPPARVTIYRDVHDTASRALLGPETTFAPSLEDRAYSSAVRNVTAAGVAVPFLARRGSLLIELQDSLDAGERLWIETEVIGDLALGAGHGKGWRTSALALGPGPGDHGRLRANYDFAVEVPAPLEPFASGKTVELTHGAVNRLRSRSEHATARPPAAVAGRYASLSEVLGEHEALVSFGDSRAQAAARRLAHNFHAARQCLESWFGVEYPFREMDLAEVGEWVVGVPPPGLILLRPEALRPPATAGATAGDPYEAWANAAATSGLNEWFSRKVANGYFPHVVHVASEEDGWITESFALYASAVCDQRTTPRARTAIDRFDRSMSRWRRSASKLRSPASVFLAGHLAGIDEADRQDAEKALYAKGPVVLHAIRQELGRQRGSEAGGDQQFFAFMRAVVRNFTFETVSTRDLVAILNQMTGRDWQPFFEKYVYGTDAPVLD
jgi:hypothetical protein